jgi:hypothetical protein
MTLTDVDTVFEGSGDGSGDAMPGQFARIRVLASAVDKDPEDVLDPSGADFGVEPPQRQCSSTITGGCAGPRDGSGNEDELAHGRPLVDALVSLGRVFERQDLVDERQQAPGRREIQDLGQVGAGIGREAGAAEAAQRCAVEEDLLRGDRRPLPGTEMIP